MGRHYADEFRREAVALVTAGHAVKAVAIELGIPQHTLWGWVYTDRDRQATAAMPRGTTEPVDAVTHQAALRRIAELERENEFLGKASAFFAKKVHP
ncbi:MAG: transposase [Chloroflexota bacterium]|jgi:transposase|nr:transposase [Chloroflexota bacterium]